MTSIHTSVGHSIERLDAAEKATGEAQYVDDLYRPGMLHGAILGSIHAHAKIGGYKLDAARSIPGVAAVLTGEDFSCGRTGAFCKDELPLARGKTIYMGEPVAVVAASDVETARRAARAIEIDYEPLPAVLTIDEALATGAPLVHEDLANYAKIAPSFSEGNVLWQCRLEEGKIDSAWSQCDVIVEDVFETAAQHHMYMEPCGALAEIDRGGRLTIWSSCQSVHLVQQRVAEWLSIPMGRIRALAPKIGGGFGAKGGLHVQHLAAALALKTGRPVKLVLSRVEDFEIVRSRHPARVIMKTGAKKDGTLLAREANIFLDGGAYADESPTVLSFAVLMARGPYRIPHLRSRGLVVYTNKLKASAFRGFGNPQVTFAGESQIDRIAEQLGIHPVELRLRNAVDAGDSWAGGQTLPACGLRECLTKLRDAVEAAPALPAAPQHRRGVGYSAFAHISGLLSTACNIYLRSDGSVAVNTGVVDIGQGSDTILTQICADALMLTPERVSFASPDSDSSPYNWKTAASRVTYMAGRVVLAATIEVRDKILRQASEIMECSAEDLEIRPGGLVGLKGVAAKTVTFAQVASHALARLGGPIMGASSLLFDGERLDPKRALIEGFAFSNLGAYIFGAQAVEAEVDEVTGAVHVLRAWSAHDVGCAINPQMVEGQIQGGFVQGLGYALTEEMQWDESGRLTNPTLMDYKVPTALDTPIEINPIIVEHPEPSGPFGAKGVGEPGLIGAAASIANAVAKATGKRLHRLPMTPERVLDALIGES
ncbi:MAG: xanthine dehydrogenase family protein molybdopterin-binding subunit [Xanthobacteraceae bacterium]